MTNWQWSTFDQLSGADVYAVLALRQNVFIIEQNCPFADADWIDQESMHLLGWTNAEDKRELQSYLRCVAPGVKYPEPSIGRVTSAFSRRGTGIGRELFAEGMRRTRLLYPEQRIRISAQLRLEAFYRGFGFETVSAPYDEDGIVHVEMMG